MTFLKGLLKKFKGKGKSVKCKPEDASPEISCENVTKPVNYQPKDASPEILKRDVGYAIQIAENWIKKLPGGSSYLYDKAVMDIGPGINFGTSLIFACYGAKAVVVDAYLSPWDQTYHPAFYSLLRDTLKKEKPELDLSPLIQIITAGRYIPEIIKCYCTPLEDLSCIPDESIDIIFSNAVFEHLADPQSAFRQLERIMRLNSLGFHQVDFRDHRDFSKPLEYLLIGQNEFQVLFKELHGECGNQYRCDEMQSFIEKTGLVIKEFVTSCFADESYLVDFMMRLKKTKKSRYYNRRKEDLRILSGHFCLYKPAKLSKSSQL